jgi:hypothetical protein|tara:strand:+ start:656 stop:1168 length:513 start_codon:yes stop_codon:yes gene_type:complete
MNTNESQLWALASTEASINTTADNQNINLPEALEYFLSLSGDYPKHQIAKLLIKVYSHLSTEELIRQTGWSQLRYYAKSQDQRDHQIKAQKKWTAKKLDFINEFKKDGCVICGYKKCLAALDFHHIDPSQKTSSVRRLSNFKHIEKEIKKCVVLCANCHREVHAGEAKLP